MSVTKNNGPIIDPALCRCCRAIKKCRILTAEYTWMENKEIYADMVMDCFGILLSHVDDNEKDSGVCATCVVRLRDACAFRQQVLQCEELFLQSKLEDKDPQGDEMKKALEIELKAEPKDDCSDQNSIGDRDNDDGISGDYSADDTEDYKPPKEEDTVKPDGHKNSEPNEMDEDYSTDSSSNSDKPIKRKKSMKKGKTKKENGTSKKKSKAQKEKAESEFIIEKTRHGKDMLITNGYQFYINVSKNNKYYWKCTEKNSKQCRCSIITEFISGYGHSIVKPSTGHTHSPNPSKIAEIILRNRLKRDAVNTISAPIDLIENNLAQIPSCSAKNMPNKQALRQIIRRARIKETAPEPKSLEEIDIPDEIKEVEGENFLASDITYGENRRMLIFSTKRNIEILQSSPIWLMDGTSQSFPGLFEQIITIHTYVGNTSKTVPMVYCLLTNKSEESFVTFFTQLKSYAFELGCVLNPGQITTDFDIDIVDVIKKEFPEAVHYGCFFHLGQNIWLKIQSCDLAPRYGEDYDFSLKLRQMVALAYLPPEQIEAAFTELKEKVLPTEANEVIIYFETNYINRLEYMVSEHGMFVNKEPPMYPPTFWSIHRNGSVQLPTTHATVEAWHRRWNFVLNQSNFGFYAICQAILKEQIATNQIIEKAKADIPTPTPKKMRKGKNQVVDKLYENRTQMSTADFLQAIAVHIDL